MKVPNKIYLDRRTMVILKGGECGMSAYLLRRVPYKCLWFLRHKWVIIGVTSSSGSLKEVVDLLRWNAERTRRERIEQRKEYEQLIKELQ